MCVKSVSLREVHVTPIYILICSFDCALFYLIASLWLYLRWLTTIPRLLNFVKWMDMINDVMSLHQDCRPGCWGALQWNLKSEDRCGLDTRMGILFATCGYESGRYTLYEDVETKSPGRKAAAVNLGLMVEPSQTPLDNDGVRKILLSTNTSPPFRNSLQKEQIKSCPW